MATDVTFVQVGDLARGITEYTLPYSDELAGRTIVLHQENGPLLELAFKSAQTLTWRHLPQDSSGQPAVASCHATSPRAGIFLVDYLVREKRATSISHVLNFNTGAAITVVGVLPSREETAQGIFSRVVQGLEPTAVQAEFIRSAIDTPFNTFENPLAPTTDLIGRHVRYVYSQTETYEHIYLNAKFYSWHCIAGIEKDLADTDRCHYYKIADNLYLFVWREKIVPTLGLVLVDFERMRTTGKLFGYQGDDFGALTNARLGAYATLVTS